MPDFSVKRLLPVRKYRLKTELLLANIGHLLRREAYYCNALSGKSDYNICVNSDMTVSCNCADIDGSGHIGDLSVNTLEEIFRGRTATKFRERLSRGIFPIGRCAVCRELMKTDRAAAKFFLSNYSTPKRGIMVENTVQCNLQCLNCQRKSILKTRKKLRMSLGDMEKVAQSIKSSNIGVISFFNLGEPFLSDTIYEELSILKKHNPDTAIYVSTNGLHLKQGKKMEAALLADYIFVSLDGATNESVNKYQVGGNFETTYKNIKDLISLRNSRNQVKPVVDWKYVVFSWNDSQAEIEKAVELAQAAKLDILSFWPGEGTPAQISTRFKNDEYFHHLGAASWKGREFDFRK